MAPAELGEPARLCGTLHRGADLAQREGGGGDRLRLERQQPQHQRQKRAVQCEWRKGGELMGSSENTEYRAQISGIYPNKQM